MTLSLRQHNVKLAAAGVTAIAVLTSLLLWPLFRTIFPLNRQTILQFQGIPVGTDVRLLGVVTYADSVGKRFWIQDDTGALVVDADPRGYGLRAGQSAILTGTKILPHDNPSKYASIELKNLEVLQTRLPFDLPPPVAVSLRTLPDKEKTGIRIQVNGIIRRIHPDDQGRVQFNLGDSREEVSATLSEANGGMLNLVNAKVHIVGVGESIYNNDGVLREKHIWVQKADDIQLEETGPAQIPLYTIRTLYGDTRTKDGRRVRIQGRVAMRPAADSVLLEDRWGAITCNFDQPIAASVGTTVEVTGFPTVDGHGLRIDLLHSSLARIRALPTNDNAPGDHPRDLTTVTSIRRLGEHEANAALPVRVTGVVTYIDPAWQEMFVQDATGGIYVRYADSRSPLVRGQRVTVIGLTNAGGYAPVIIAPKFLVVGKAPMPRPIPLGARDAPSGILDSQWVEVEGVIHLRKADEESERLTFELFSSFGQIRVYGDSALLPYVRHLEDASVRMRGVLGTMFNSRRQLVGDPELAVSSAEDITVLHPSGPGPSGEAVIPVSSLLRFSPQANFRHRLKVKGTVTMIGRGFFYMQDDSGGLQVQGDTNSLRLADLVEAVGYVSPGGGYSPIMTDTTVRVAEHNLPVSARRVTPESLLQGQFDSQIVVLEGRLLSAMDSIDGKRLVLQAGSLIFNAELASQEDQREAPQLEEGSVLQLTGVCSAQVDPNRLFQLKEDPPLGFRLLLRSIRDVKVLRPASWWSVRHALAGLETLLLVVVGAFVWLAVLQRRMRIQTEELQGAREKAEAIGNLANAMESVTERDDFAIQVPISGTDEIAQLGMGFNKMLVELKRRDIAKLAAEQKLQDLALTDELTGLPNRRLLSDRLSQSLAVAKRESRILAVLYIDLDGFKLVNDNLGHTAGDVLLGQVSQRLQSRVREADTLARIGGDEFAVVLTRLHATEEAAVVAQALLSVLTKQFVLENHEIRIGASIGISLFPEHGEDAADLLQRADAAMYAAKRNGRNQVVQYTADLGSSIHERSSLENELRGAVARGEICVHYQPEFDVSSGRLVRFEALARWIHPTLGMVPPDKFIPIAEESGQIVALGAYIMERACQEAVKWQALANSPTQVAVNVSSLQFARPLFAEEVAEILRRTGLPPGLLQIELTESVMLRGPERAAETMRKLRALGVSLAIDDFGTGYSCLSYLTRLPFNALKIDRSFVNELATRPEILAMVRSLITLSHELKMQVIVEGIETSQQFQLVKELGGNEVQGYLLGRPTMNPESHLCEPRSQAEVCDFELLVPQASNQ